MIRPIVRGFKAFLPSGKKYRRIARGPARGCMMAVDFRSDLKAYLGMFEYELNSHFKRMLKPGSTCFDIGGSGGYHSLVMARTTGARVVSFECDQGAAEEMRSIFAQNPALHIEVIEAYVGAKNGDGFITIDRAARDFFIPNLIKLDIEGAEDSALEGASETLANHHPGLIIEVHGADKEANCIALLHSHGYEVQVINQGWFLKDTSRGDGHNRWLAAYPTVISK